MLVLVVVVEEESAKVEFAVVVLVVDVTVAFPKNVRTLGPLLEGIAGGRATATSDSFGQLRSIC